MGLLDTIMTANGDNAANYAKKGRYVIRLASIRLRDASEPGADTTRGNGFRFSGDVLACSNDVHSKGELVTFTDPMRFPTALARIRKLIQLGKQAKEGREIQELTFGLVAKEGEADADFANRIKAEAKRLLGPDQPLTGAIVTIVVTEGENQKTKAKYTLFDAVPTSEDDLKAAGLIPA